jgi:hypothetical protein
MSERLDRAKRYHEAIHEVLLHEWDPIGVADIAEAQDEYDGYVGELYAMLIRHVPRSQLVDHLWWIETEHMALHGSRQKTEEIADRLLAIRDQLEGQRPSP